MVQWMRFVIGMLLSGTVFTAPGVFASEEKPPVQPSLPELGSQAAQQEEQNTKGKTLKEEGADYFINSATQGFDNLTPQAL